jgi:hypothetical protein
VVLGFTALRLSDDRDPHAPHAEPQQPGIMVTLRTLLDEGLVTDTRRLRGTAPRIPGSPLTRAALGYLTANCGHCHHEESRAATVRHPTLMPPFATRSQAGAIVHRLQSTRTAWDLPHAQRVQDSGNEPDGGPRHVSPNGFGRRT